MDHPADTGPARNCLAGPGTATSRIVTTVFEAMPHTGDAFLARRPGALRSTGGTLEEMRDACDLSRDCGGDLVQDDSRGVSRISRCGRPALRLAPPGRCHATRCNKVLAAKNAHLTGHEHDTEGSGAGDVCLPRCPAADGSMSVHGMRRDAQIASSAVQHDLASMAVAA